MAADMVLIYDAIKELRGGWCDDCSCQFAYHTTIPESGICELCGCISIYKKLDMPHVPILSSLKKKSGPRRSAYTFDGEWKSWDTWEKERAKEARLVLAELTE